jgi:hypothetical protein
MILGYRYGYSKTCDDQRSLLLIVDLDIIVGLLSSFALAGGTTGSVRRPMGVQSRRLTVVTRDS